ncbi:hypothetical protein AUC68_10575 [Methyloceanibacter methanicus]|uniref:Uncharacterized protein n=1 Tax=Methyloceanibacter methanicus TaxID=1774968 RepID=A0A1E3VWP7_9HYPH|nr:hypothetical protein AUC68_10575 [Methyloceanibacter methanicus]
MRPRRQRHRRLGTADIVGKEGLARGGEETSDLALLGPEHGMAFQKSADVLGEHAAAGRGIKGPVQIEQALAIGVVA